MFWGEESADSDLDPKKDWSATIHHVPSESALAGAELAEIGIGFRVLPRRVACTIPGGALIGKSDSRIPQGGARGSSHQSSTSSFSADVAYSSHLFNEDS